MSNPIALPVQPHASQDYHMGSYNGDGDGTFNPASYNRHFFGSPISWRAGSFGAQFVPSQSPTAMLVGSYDKGKSPHDSSILNAWNVFDHQGELCRNYSCCGVTLPDLHALLEHFEDVHIVVKDRAQPPSIQIPFNPTISTDSVPAAPQPLLPQTTQQYSTPFDTDDMDLGLDDYEDASPPPPSTAPTSARTSRAPSPVPSTSSAPQRPALNIALGFGMHTHSGGLHTPLSASRAAPFSAYSRYNSAEGSPVAEGSSQQDAMAVAPNLVFATGEELTGGEPESALPPPTKHSKTSKRHRDGHGHPPSPPSASSSNPPSRVSTPSSASASSSHVVPSSAASSSASNASANANLLLNTAAGSAAAATILLPQKPFRCPKPHCSKSYKQANGLKYHMTHGSCSYGPPKDVEAVRALLERKRAAAANADSAHSSTASPTTSSPSTPSAASASSKSTAQQNPTTAQSVTVGGLSQAELNEVEARMRPFACGVGDCSRRYKNMNGLRYHYQHSGDHGAVGLGMLAGGVHGCLKANGGAGTVNANASAPATTAPPPANTNANANGKTATYAWGSTLLPHIQAVATTGKGASAPSTPAPTASTTTFAITPQAATFAPQNATQTQSQQAQTQFQRAQQAQQYAQWYATGTGGAGTPTQQVDVSMG